MASLLLRWGVFLGLAGAAFAGPFQFDPLRHSCGVCREVQRGLGCEHFGACGLVNATAAAAGCDAFCPPAAAAPAPVHATAPDVRVTKGFGTKAYDQVRISVISRSAAPPSAGFFDYSAQFRYKWTDNYLHTALKTAVPGGAAAFDVGAEVSVRLPSRGAGVAAVLIADPCVTDGVLTWVFCKFGSRFQTKTRTPALINAFVPDNSTDFWGILGDNFYDRSGSITESVFSGISLAAKSKLFVTVPGNHDYWVMGDPHVSTVLDQCANGFMQFYAQDAKAAEAVQAGSPAAPFDFSVDPNKGRTLGLGCNPTALTNTFWYNQIGNVGIVGQSGAHDLEESRPLMAEACAWLGQQPGLRVALLLGHWDLPGLGADPEMAMPKWYSEMAVLPGCDKFKQRGMLKYVMGHTHCNDPHPYGDVGAGFRVAGFGMDGCGNYGVPILDTTEDRVRFWYFDTQTDELYDKVMACVTQSGWRGCLDLATTWLDEPLGPAAAVELLM